VGDLLPCPFCGETPEVYPRRPEIEGDAFGQVRCENDDCQAKPVVNDGEDCADDRGSDLYKLAAIKRWNRRALPLPSQGLPVAWMARAENGNIRLWVREESAKVHAEAQGLVLEPLYADPAPSQGLGEGWVLVPREPTEEMLRAAWAMTVKVTPEERMLMELGDSRSAFHGKMKRRYRAMISAAPPLSGGSK
jgi:hypothetical protein